jgi:isoleucyl-tRNA synthetase
MSAIAKAISSAKATELLADARKNGQVTIRVDGQDITILENELDIRAFDKEGFCAEGEGGYYVVLDTTITPELLLEGIARELVSKIQNMRKEAGFEVEDKIYLYCVGDETIAKVLEVHGEEIKADTLALAIETSLAEDGYTREWDLNDHKVTISVKKA